jgi:hypothetical protein
VPDEDANVAFCDADPSSYDQPRWTSRAGAQCLVEGELPGWMIATGEPAVSRRTRVLKAPEAAP